MVVCQIWGERSKSFNTYLVITGGVINFTIEVLNVIVNKPFKKLT